MKEGDVRVPVIFKLAEIMEQYPLTRDDDLVLYELYLKQYCGVSPLAPLTLIHQYVRKGEVLPMESVVRLRRMVQVDRPDLRGMKWEERHKKAEAERLKQLGIPSTIAPDEVGGKEIAEV